MKRDYDTMTYHDIRKQPRPDLSKVKKMVCLSFLRHPYD